MKDNNRLSLGCVVMAAGNGQRFGANKLQVQVEGKALIHRALEAVPSQLLDAVCVVTQYDEVEALAGGFGFRCLRNLKPELGLSHTVVLGTRALRDSCDGIVYLVSDQPLLRRESVAALLTLWRENPERIVAASHRGRRGSPCVFPRRYFDELCALTGDTGGSAVIRRHPRELLLLEMEARELADVDTRADLAALER